MKHPNIFLARQPILNRNRQIVAYELLFRDSEINQATIINNFSATAYVVANAFDKLGSSNVLGKRIGFINMDAELLMSNIVESLPKGQVVLELLENIKIDDQVVNRCRQLKRMGYSLALDDFIQHSKEYDPLLEIVDIVKVDILSLSQAELNQLVQRLKACPVKLLAEKVESIDGNNYCRNLGFDLYQGFLFAAPMALAA